MSELPKTNIWKKIAIRAFFGGIGFAVAGTAIVGGLIWYSDRPKPTPPWDKAALKATWDTMQVGMGGKDPTSYSIKFFYKVQNTTKQNYDFSASAFTPMAVLTDGRLLSKDFGYRTSGPPVIDGPTFIPPGVTARVTVEISYLYPDGFTDADKQSFDKVIVSVDNKLKELDSFVLFDQMNHYEIDLPEGWKDVDGVKEGTKPPKAKN
jgi:hypothetical protein